MSSKNFPIGIFSVLFISSFAIVIASPLVSLLSMTVDSKEESGIVTDVYPQEAAGMVALGRKVYISEGCTHCHSQVVRAGSGSDVGRGWGVRVTLPKDYMLEKPSMFGDLRLGPDLSNYGSERWRLDRSHPESGKFDRNRLLLKLYAGSKGASMSSMPLYGNLFEVRRRNSAGSQDALNLDGVVSVPMGWEVVPKPTAVALVAYLESLDRQRPLATFSGSLPAAKE